MLVRHRLGIHAVPIFRNLALGLLERQAPGTNFSVQIALYSILAVRPAVRDGGVERLGPKIFGIGGIAAQFEGDEMILLIIPQSGVRVTVFANLLNFQAMCVTLLRPDGFGAPPGIADGFAEIFLGYLWIHRARGSPGIGIDIGGAGMNDARFRGRGSISGWGLRANEPDDDDNHHDDEQQNRRYAFSIPHRVQFNSCQKGRACASMEKTFV